MNLYLFENVYNVSPNYHSDGGVVIVAENKEHVEELVAEYNAEYIATFDRGDVLILTEEDWKEVVIYPLQNIITVLNDTVNKIEPKIYIFPNAGCC